LTESRALGHTWLPPLGTTSLDDVSGAMKMQVVRSRSNLLKRLLQWGWALIPTALLTASPVNVWAQAPSSEALTPDQHKSSTPWNPLTWQWVPTDAEIQKYRQSWNPLTHGPVLVTIADTLPPGQLYVRPFIYAQIAERSYTNQFAVGQGQRSGPVHLYSVQDPYLQFGYGINNHFQFGMATSMNSWWANDSEGYNQGRGGPWKTNTGMGDTSIYFKYRPIVQDPGNWRPSMTFHTQLNLPTGTWFTDTKKPPGGFAPIGRLPTTQFGSLAVTEGAVFRKNLEPFRINAGMYYTYHPPGNEGGDTTYVSDILNTRLVVEYIVSEKYGLAYNLELVSLHHMAWRTDGHAINRGPANGATTLGVEPAVQWRFGDSNFMAAAGCLFTVAGQNALDSIYPNVSLFWYWSETGKIIMR
jgi:hypothetical protein